jgi:hypothetical protein
VPFQGSILESVTQKSQKNLVIEVFGVTWEPSPRQMMSIATQWMKDHVWPEIEAMMLNDAHFRLVLSARQLTGKFNGPTAKLLQDGYLTYQMVTIRRLCDIDSKVISLRRALMEAAKEKPAFKAQIDQLLDSLTQCDHVCRQVDKHVAHTANPAQPYNLVPWNMGMQHLEAAHKVICQAAIVLNRDTLHWANFIEIMPVPQYYFGEDLILWVPEQLRNSLHKAWHDNRRRVNAWLQIR